MKKSLGAKTLIYPTPAWMVGTYDEKGKPNVMAAAWAGVCCSKPPCITISLRKATYSYGCLMHSKAYTLNVLSEDQLTEADYFGIASGRDEDKFEVSGFTPVKSELVNAPYIKEAPMILECKIIHTYEIGLHTQFIGEIIDVKADESVLDEKDNPSIEKVKPIIYATGDRCYYGVGKKLERAYKVGMPMAKHKE